MGSESSIYPLSSLLSFQGAEASRVRVQTRFKLYFTAFAQTKPRDVLTQREASNLLTVPR